MASLNFVEQYLLESISVKNKLLNDKRLTENILQVADSIVDCFQSGGKLLLAGNGGSAGDAQHLAAEFVSKFFYDRPGLPAIALTTDTSILSAIGNDYGFENLFSRQVQAHGNVNDILIGISTSGTSQNVIKAVKEARKIGLTTVAFCGSSGALFDLTDMSVCVPSKITPYIQECHIVVGHIICALVEEAMYPRAKFDV